MSKKTFIVLVPVDNNLEARRHCESIENYKFDIGGSVQATAMDVKHNVVRLIQDTFDVSDCYDLNTIEVEALTDYMDRCNNQELDLEMYFISYVHG